MLHICVEFLNYLSVLIRPAQLILMQSNQSVPEVDSCHNGAVSWYGFDGQGYDFPLQPAWA